MTTKAAVQESYSTLWEVEEMITTLRHKTGLSQYELLPMDAYKQIALAWSEHRQGLNTQALDTVRPARALLTAMVARYGGN